MHRSGIERREFLLGAIGAPLCCAIPALPPNSVAFRGGEIHIDLAGVPELRRTGAAFAVVDQDRLVNLILIHAEPGRYVAMDRSCTHGGAQCTYNPKRHTVQCTSLNHAEYDMQGTLLHGRTHGNLRAYPTQVSASTLVIHLEQV